MSFDEKWEKEFSENRHQSYWPWTDLISLFMRYARPTGKPFRVLEIGCGVGANIAFFKSMGDRCEYYALEGSKSAVKKILERHPDLENNVVCTDFTNSIPFSKSLKFDFVIDRASLTCNSTQSIQNFLKIISSHLNDQAKFIGIDWYSTESSLFRDNKDLVDKNTIANIGEGALAGIGTVHFSDLPHLQKLFENFDFDYLVRKSYTDRIPDNRQELVTWN